MHTDTTPLNKELSEITDELSALQDELRTLAARRTELQNDSAAAEAEIAELDSRLTALRRRRVELQDRQLAIQRELASIESDTVASTEPAPASPDYSSARDTSSRDWLRGIATLVLVMGVVIALGGVLLFGAVRFLAPPDVDGVANTSAPDESTEPKSLEQQLIGLYLALNRDAIRQPAGTDDSPVVFVVEPGETAATIGQRLEAEGLITDAAVFRRLIAYRGVDQSLAAGTFQLRRTMTMDEIIVALQSGRPEELVITIPEGWRAEEVAARLEAEGLFSAEAYLALVAEPARFADEFPFLQDVPTGQTLEGFLFPDTYSVIQDDVTPEAFIRMQLSTFDQRVSPALREAMADKDMSLYEALTLASIIEREAVVEEERPVIAGVFENRWRDDMLLNADPTVQYALGYDAESESWWKRPLLLDDLEVESPYNTYRYPGLPPSPICNPGLAAIRAAATAPPTDYYYFVSRGDGTHVFAETLEEHQRNVEQYRP